MPEVIYFYSSIVEYGVLSNFASTPLILDYQIWPTSVHLFHALKFTGDADNYAYREFIRSQPSVRSVPRLGKTRTIPIRSDWDKIKVKAMLRILRLKSYQHESVVDCLKTSGAALLVEKSPTDYFWGCGAKGTGKNMLGKLWMQIRSEL
jgi:N-glycosidase YbiA